MRRADVLWLHAARLRDAATQHDCHGEFETARCLMDACALLELEATLADASAVQSLGPYVITYTVAHSGGNEWCCYCEEHNGHERPDDYGI